MISVGPLETLIKGGWMSMTPSNTKEKDQRDVGEQKVEMS